MWKETSYKCLYQECFCIFIFNNPCTAPTSYNLHTCLQVSWLACPVISVLCLLRVPILWTSFLFMFYLLASIVKRNKCICKFITSMLKTFLLAVACSCTKAYQMNFSVTNDLLIHCCLVIFTSDFYIRVKSSFAKTKLATIFRLHTQSSSAHIGKSTEHV